MNYIKRFNESVNYNEYFTVSDDDIEDVCLEMIDSGFKFRIDKRWLSGGVKSKEPIKSKSIPIYEIDLWKEEENCSSDNNRWNGSYYLDEYSTLRIFTSVLNRLGSYGKCYYYISNNNYHIMLYLEEVHIETGFDWDIFEKEFTYWTSTIDTNYAEKEEDDLFYLHDKFSRTEAFGGSSLFTYEFKTRLVKQQIAHDILEADKDMDNKEMYSELINLIKNKLSKYSKYVDFNIKFEEPKEYIFDKKRRFKRSKELIYIFYTLSVSIKPKKSKS
jgi:hypothetical protein